MGRAVMRRFVRVDLQFEPHEILVRDQAAWASSGPGRAGHRRAAGVGDRRRWLLAADATRGQGRWGQTRSPGSHRNEAGSSDGGPAVS